MTGKELSPPLEADPRTRKGIQAFLSGRLDVDELAAVFDVLEALDPPDILATVQRSGRKACLALFAMLRAMASVAPTDASFMIGYDPVLVRQGPAGQESPGQEELEWWQDLMGFLFVGTFAGRWPDQLQAILFRNELIEYLWSFPPILLPREQFWRRVSEHRKADRLGFQPGLSRRL